MRISAARTIERRAGFTLIELVMVLAVAAVILGGAVGVMTFSSDRRQLDRVSGEVEQLAKRARTVSLVHQTPYAIEFLPGIVRLLPLAEVGMDETFFSGREVGGARVDPETGRRQPVRQSVGVPEDMEIFIRRWATNDFQPMSERFSRVWRFDPDGLTEPVTLRYAVGRSWKEDTFHPLTATVANSEMEAR